MKSSQYYQMIVILGTQSCKYCKEVKQYLKEGDTYIDLKKYHGDDWRIIFKKLAHLEVKTIPIAFQLDEENGNHDLSEYGLEGKYTYFGQYSDIVNKLYTVDFDEDY